MREEDFYPHQAYTRELRVGDTVRLFEGSYGYASVERVYDDHWSKRRVVKMLRPGVRIDGNISCGSVYIENITYDVDLRNDMMTDHEFVVVGCVDSARSVLERHERENGKRYRWTRQELEEIE